ncbi:hypothetical protein A2943_03310 [Candidatus Adlerbacteria bacterium RIFCSPLOWO2_01_FULL_51_16]|uniref:Uncharacterized protein n=1 Tax=Candidatus Adlerbacteria bacterium RIFCSPLOWO2_01_FULL_51_16 TaxID=1797243 RepID=A0A1F4XEM4_9BACT|nr:MAG: hypothetical protein A2943_03310 [Candidatus Adlerbacteria bacterium RIFCSPLOWO2_01_FULL_51_16]
MHQIIHFRLIATRVAALLGGLVTLLAFLYGGLLLGAVAHTAAQTKIERQVHALAEKVHTFETQYFAALRSITPAAAQERGFVAPAEITTVFATAASRTLTLQGFKSL